jgi:hypothetical protein
MQNEKKDEQKPSWIMRLSLIALKTMTFTLLGIVMLLTLSYLVSPDAFSKTTVLTSINYEQIKTNRLVFELNNEQLKSGAFGLQIQHLNKKYSEGGFWKVRGCQVFS